MWYKLEGKIPVKCEDMVEGAKSFGESRAVKQQKYGKTGVFVSTVFLGIDHGWNGGPPVLFETMVFGGKYDNYQERYCTWDEAFERHVVINKMVRLHLKKSRNHGRNKNHKRKHR